MQADLRTGNLATYPKAYCEVALATLASRPFA
jgi:hypothetical protein